MRCDLIATSPKLFVEQITQAESQRFTAQPSEKTTVHETRWPGMMRLTTLAKYMDMSVSSVSNMIKSGELPQPTIAPTRRLQRWSRACIDAHFQKKQETNLKGPSIDDLMARSFAANQGGR